MQFSLLVAMLQQHIIRLHVANAQSLLVLLVQRSGCNAHPFCVDAGKFMNLLC